MPEWLTAALTIASGLAGGGIAWGVMATRLSRVEADVKERATSERVAGIEKVMDARHDGLEKKLDKIEDTLELIRDELARRREDTAPGRR